MHCILSPTLHMSPIRVAGIERRVSVGVKVAKMNAELNLILEKVGNLSLRRLSRPYNLKKLFRDSSPFNMVFHDLSPAVYHANLNMIPSLFKALFPQTHAIQLVIRK